MDRLIQPSHTSPMLSPPRPSAGPLHQVRLAPLGPGTDRHGPARTLSLSRLSGPSQHGTQHPASVLPSSITSLGSPHAHQTSSPTSRHCTLAAAGAPPAHQRTAPGHHLPPPAPRVPSPHLVRVRIYGPMSQINARAKPLELTRALTPWHWWRPVLARALGSDFRARWSMEINESNLCVHHRLMRGPCDLDIYIK